MQAGWKGLGSSRAVETSHWIRTGFETSLHLARRHSQPRGPGPQWPLAGRSYVRHVSGYAGSEKALLFSLPFEAR